MTPIAQLVSVLRVHIVLIAMCACLVFGWLFTGEYPFEIAGLVGLDWLLINLLNKISDVTEDQQNKIAGADLVAKHRSLFFGGWLLVQAVSLGLGAVLFPALTLWRIGVQLVGVGYSYKIVPTARGMRRFKDIYFLKNFMSAMLFVTTGFIYPLAAANWSITHAKGGWALAMMLLFFVAFEITYEIMYDLRDLDGDRAQGIPTFPVVHGAEYATGIIDGLLALAGAAVVAGFLFGAFGVREVLFIAAPIAQYYFYSRRMARGLTSADCVLVTNLGSAMLVLFLLGTAAWAALGWPDNFYIA